MTLPAPVVTAYASGTAISVSWSAPGQAAWHVQIFDDKGTAGSSYGTEFGGAGATTFSYVVHNLPNGRTYSVGVQVGGPGDIQSGGVGDWSPETVVSGLVVSVTPGSMTKVTNPAVGSTVTNATPTLGGTGRDTNNLALMRQWQFARDAGFTVSSQLVAEKAVNYYNYNSPAPADIPFPSTATPLTPQGTWYVRGRLLDSSGIFGPWTTSHQFTIAHPPLASAMSPFGNQAIGYSANPVLSWTFGDPYSGDRQTAYRVRLWKKADKAGSLVDTGKVTSTASSRATGPLTTTWKNVELRWTIQLWDMDDVMGVESAETAFIMRDAPVVAVVNPPNAGTVTNPNVTVTWTATSTSAQASASVNVFRVADNFLVASSGVLTGGTFAWAIPGQSLKVGAYRIEISSTNVEGITGSVTSTFSASYVAQTSPILTANDNHFDTLFRIDLDWSTTAIAAGSLGWRVHRRAVDGGDWLMIYSGMAMKFSDFTAPSNQLVEYGAAQLFSDGFGGVAESVWGITTVDLTARYQSYALVVPDDTRLNMPLNHVTGDSFSDEHEVNVSQIIGKGTLFDYGTRFGHTGTLDAMLLDDLEMTAVQQRERISNILSSGLPVFLRNPFGDVLLVLVESVSFTRVLGGSLADAQLSFSYSEIAQQGVWSA